MNSIEINITNLNSEQNIYIDITKPAEGDSVMIPEKSDYTVAE